MKEEPALPDSFTVVEHPLIQHKLTLMRRADTPTTKFRQLLREISLLLGYEVTRGLKLDAVDIETPLEPMRAPILEGKKLCIVSILRAGNGLLDGMLDLIPNARVGHVGLYRDHETLEPVEYYFKMPENLGERDVIVVDPMLATGNSAVAAVERLKRAGAKRLGFLCLLAAPEGVAAFEAEGFDATVWTASIDQGLNDVAFILPGLGDAGDRMYGTK